MAILNRSASNNLYVAQSAIVYNGKGLPTYGNVVDANDYFQFRLFVDAWTQAEMKDRKAALAQATRIIDSLNYVGTKLDSDQFNMFPRTGMDEIPTDVIHACYEIALKLLEGFDPDVEVDNTAKVGQGYAAVKSTYTRDYVLEHISAGVPSQSAWKSLRKYLLDPNRIIVRRGS